MSDNDPTHPSAAPPAAGIAEQREPPQPRPPEEGEGDEGPDEGDDGAQEAQEAAGAPAPDGQAAPVQASVPGSGRRRRRRRRRRAQVHFTPDGQAYRMVQGPDGQMQQVFLTPQELQQYQARMQQAPPQNRAAAQGQPAAAPAQLAPIEGVLDTDVKGPNAFLRQVKRNLIPTQDDPELPKNLVQKLRLRQGQFITAQANFRGNKGVVQKVDAADGVPLDAAPKLPHFGDLTSIDPVDRIHLEHSPKEMVTRVLDLIAPFGKGQRALIVAPPKTGKTIMLQRIAQATIANHPEIYVMVLLIDERPEEVTDMRRSIDAEVLASNADRGPAEHLKVAELALERARRMVESGKDVMILLDSITRLARAYNKEIDSSGRTMTGGIDSRAMERPKRAFGAARATEEAGTLTIVGTALIDTGSRMDEVIFEEFKGTGNSEITLDRLLAEKRVWPAINIPQSSTRKEEKLFTAKEYEKVKKLRQMLFAVKPVEAMEALVKRLSRYTYNDEFLEEL
ncbi:MAG: transcription termination factor Rho [Myxococcales bacterium]|nr:transcription termination factor Rho [Myxococcales bacterium]